jgi:hypothetical protein
MGQRLIITEEEKNNILNQYNLIDEQVIFGGMLPNPNKTITVNVPIEKVEEIVEYLPTHILKEHLGLGGYYFKSKEKIFNDVVFEIMGGELMSLGVIISITLSKITENSTQIDIEIRRAHGAFDRAIEVQKASEHMQNILKGLSFGVDSKNYEKIKDTYRGQKNVLGFGFKNYKEYQAAGEPDVHLMYDNGFRTYQEYLDAGSPELKSSSQLKKEKKDKEREEKEKLGIKPSFWDKLFGS